MVPPLAALCAKMTTWKVKERFTAAEALSFYVDHVSPLRDERAVALEPSFEHMRDPDVYWSLLSPGDRHRWRTYKVPKQSYFIMFLFKPRLRWPLSH